MATAHHEIVPGRHNFFNMAVIPLPTRHCQVKNDDASLAKNTDHLTSTVTPEAMENATAGLGWEEIGGTAQDARVSGIPICVLHLVLRRTDIGSTREAAYVLSRKGENSSNAEMSAS